MTASRRATLVILAPMCMCILGSTCGIRLPAPFGNHSPVANDQSVSTGYNAAQAITLAGSDADDDALIFSIVTQPQHGVLTGTAPDVIFTPTTGYNGSDSFTFKVNDGFADSNPATVSLTVLPSNNTDPNALVLDLGEGMTMEFVLIPAGTFPMGDISGIGSAEERPVHTITISKAFYLGKYEITQAQWQAVTGASPPVIPWINHVEDDNFNHDRFMGTNLPVAQASWHDAQTFCSAALTKTGHAVRLPTEAEWEYACRAGASTDYCFGDDVTPLGNHAWYVDNSSDQTHEVGKKLPNAWGLFDMHGNVSEWCNDWYGPYSGDSQTDPPGASNGTIPDNCCYVIRGGNLYSSPIDCRSAYRTFGELATSRTYKFGFRCVVEAP